MSDIDLDEAIKAVELQVATFDTAAASAERHSAVSRSELLKFADLTSKAMYAEDSKSMAETHKLSEVAKGIAAASLSLANEAKAGLDQVRKAREQVEADRLELEKLRERTAVLERAQATKVTLNVGGQLFDTSIDTLRSAGDSFFACLFGGKWVAKSDAHDGSIFIDRDGTHFRHILNSLRDGDKTVLPNDAATLSSIAAEADFFGMPDLATRVRNQLQQKDADTLNSNAPDAAHHGWGVGVRSRYARRDTGPLAWGR
ncbi:BTB/POZ protein [Blyttiomyces helicus]|uniref:BTB/POZ protein n=1 Tax=Blyttiomyces helicus TaxID=388810 RepID=A0A4V1IQ61_9FUNG|nr:BTB/POZ protein [Blyttiomyces helicus]|eukprot:RKO85437.1 BTB/POZ protein [Blyttiomyces helicus]